MMILCLFVPALFGFTDIMSSCFVLFHFSENSVPRPTSDWSGTITQIRVSVAVKVMRSSLAREFRGSFDLAESSLDTPWILPGYS